MAKCRKLYNYFVFNGDQSEIEAFWGSFYAVEVDTFSTDEDGALHVNAPGIPEKVIPVGGVFLPRLLEVYPTLEAFQAEYEAV